MHAIHPPPPLSILPMLAHFPDLSSSRAVTLPARLSSPPYSSPLTRPLPWVTPLPSRYVASSFGTRSSGFEWWNGYAGSSRTCPPPYAPFVSGTVWCARCPCPSERWRQCPAPAESAAGRGAQWRQPGARADTWGSGGRRAGGRRCSESERRWSQRVRPWRRASRRMGGG